MPPLLHPLLDFVCKAKEGPSASITNLHQNATATSSFARLCLQGQRGINSIHNKSESKMPPLLHPLLDFVCKAKERLSSSITNLHQKCHHYFIPC
eukprot:2578329-Ditylum_brightwellii.AAC.1